MWTCQKVAWRLGPDVCAVLQGFHSFTGCDSTSAFTYCGRKVAFNLVIEGLWQAMKDLKKEFYATETLALL